MKKYVLVTGGAGYIGSHACKALAKEGFIPVTYDNLSLGHRSAVKWGPLVEKDLRDRAALDAAFREHRPVAVLHFASDALVVESVMNPGKYYSNNVISSVCLLEAMRDHKVDCLIFSSSCATYGQALSLPIDETHPQHPINPYGRTKLIIEEILPDFEKAHGIRSVCLRYFNAAGADREGEIGENHTPETHLIPSVIQAALELREEIVIFGDDFETKDGSAVRDYTHVEDLADAHVAALKGLLSGKGSNVFNLGTGHGYSVFEVVQMVEKVCGKRVPRKIVARRAGEPAALVADATKAGRILGWMPKRSDLRTIISSAIRWHESLLYLL